MKPHEPDPSACTGDTGFEEEGVLVFDEQRRLVAVLVHLSEEHEVAPGQWFLEAGFGPLSSVSFLVFTDLEEARNWISRRLTFGRDAA